MLKNLFKIEKKFTYLYLNVQKKYACFEICTKSHCHRRTLYKHSKNNIDALVNKQRSAHVDNHVRLMRYQSGCVLQELHAQLSKIRAWRFYARNAHFYSNDQFKFVASF